MKKPLNKRKFIPLVIILLLMIIAYATNFTHYFSFEELKEKKDFFKSYVVSYPLTSATSFILLYALTIALSLPIGSLLSIFGGFLFTQPWSTLFVLIGATFGATVIFLIAKTAIGEILRDRFGTKLGRMRKGFQENATSYLLFLRLVPLFPFWMVNIAPAFFGVPLFTFVWTTFIGIIPGAFVFTQAGAGLGSIIDQGDELTIGAIFTQDIKIALIALGIFALLPVIIKKFRKKKNDR